MGFVVIITSLILSSPLMINIIDETKNGVKVTSLPDLKFHQALRITKTIEPLVRKLVLICEILYFQELMKIAGIQEWMLWFNWFLNSLLVGLVIYTIVTYLLQFDFNGPRSAAIYFVQPSILWTCIILYHIANISFCFVFCAAFNSSEYRFLSH